MDKKRSDPIILGPEEGRHYALGGMRALFKADEAETEADIRFPNGGLIPIRPGPARIATKPMTTFST